MQCEGRVWGVGSLLDRDSHSLFCLSVIVALRVLGLSKGYRSPFGKVDLRNATDCVKQGVHQARVLEWGAIVYLNGIYYKHSIYSVLDGLCGSFFCLDGAWAASSP